MFKEMMSNHAEIGRLQAENQAQQSRHAYIVAQLNEEHRMKHFTQENRHTSRYHDLEASYTNVQKQLDTLMDKHKVTQDKLNDFRAKNKGLKEQHDQAVREKNFIGVEKQLADGDTRELKLKHLELLTEHGKDKTPLTWIRVNGEGRKGRVKYDAHKTTVRGFPFSNHVYTNDPIEPPPAMAGQQQRARRPLYRQQPQWQLLTKTSQYTPHEHIPKGPPIHKQMRWRKKSSVVRRMREQHGINSNEETQLKKHLQTIRLGASNGGVKMLQGGSSGSSGSSGSTEPEFKDEGGEVRRGQKRPRTGSSSRGMSERLPDSLNGYVLRMTVNPTGSHEPEPKLSPVFGRPQIKRAQS